MLTRQRNQIKTCLFHFFLDFWVQFFHYGPSGSTKTISWNFCEVKKGLGAHNVNTHLLHPFQWKIPPAWIFDWPTYQPTFWWLKWQEPNYFLQTAQSNLIERNPSIGIRLRWMQRKLKPNGTPKSWVKFDSFDSCDFGIGLIQWRRLWSMSVDYVWCHQSILNQICLLPLSKSQECFDIIIQDTDILDLGDFPLEILQ